MLRMAAAFRSVVPSVTAGFRTASSSSSQKNVRVSASVGPQKSLGKSAIIEKILEKVNVNGKKSFSKAEADLFTDAFLDVVQESVAGGEKVTFVGFGSFQAKERAARQGRNPSTQEPMTIPARKAVSFSVGSRFKTAVQGPPAAAAPKKAAPAPAPVEKTARTSAKK